MNIHRSIVVSSISQKYIMVVLRVQRAKIQHLKEKIKKKYHQSFIEFLISSRI